MALSNLNAEVYHQYSELWREFPWGGGAVQHYRAAKKYHGMVNGRRECGSSHIPVVLSPMQWYDLPQ